MIHPDKFAVKLDRCVGSCNNLKDLSNKVCISNKIKDINLSVFNITTGINESKIRINHVNVNVSLMEQNVIQINGGIKISVDVNVKSIMKL